MTFYATSSMPFTDDLTVITGLKEIYDASNTFSGFEYIYFHIPFIFWIVIAVPTLWIGSRLIIEFLVRLRK